MAEFEVFEDARRYGDAIEPLLARDPIGATMLSAVLAGQLADPAPPGAGPLLACLRDLDGAAAAVLRTVPYPLLVVADPALRDRAATMDLLAGALAETGESIVGFHGRREVVRDLAAAWQRRTGMVAQPRMWSLYYRLDRLVEPAPVPGRPRPLSDDDPAQVDLLAGWLRRFELETGMAREGHAADIEFVRRAVRRGSVYTLWWVDEVPVAVAGRSALRADGGCRIAPVYTPPEHRRRGFGAAATVAAIHSAWAQGATEVTLFTDEDYRPSNELYRSLGFEPIAEFAEFDVSTVMQSVADPAGAH
jgi:predicted GNAT family acetyltransferase